jgi:hypothetical protein
MRYDPKLKEAVAKRLIAWTELRELPVADRRGAPASTGKSAYQEMTWEDEE